MKKHIIIFAAAITPLAFFSCKKEKIENQQTDPATNEITFKPIFKPVADLKSHLVGMYQFDGNLKEQTGQLADAIPNINGADVYTDDRKGNANSAIKFTGRYGLDIFKIPLDRNMSVAAWVKYDVTAGVSANYFVTAQWLSPDFSQDFDTYWGVVSTPMTSGVPSASMDNQWHHLVATYDGKELLFYVDGNYVGNSVNPNNAPPYPAGLTVNYQVGYLTPAGGKIPTSTWFGTMDDLRFYTRVLSSVDVKALYQL